MQGQIHKPCAMKLFGENKKSNSIIFQEKLDKLNKNISVIGNYISAKDKVQVKCKICDYIWDTTPNNLLHKNRNTGCPQCHKRKRKTTEDLYKEIQDNPKNNIDILEEIINSYTKIKVKCNECGHIWSTTPTSLSRNGCPNCDLIKRTKTHEQFIEEVHSVNPNIKIIGKYKKQTEKILCSCLIDGYEWETTGDNLLKGTGCPICKASKGERKCKLFFDQNNIEYIQQKTYKELVGLNNGLLRYDFYLPKYDLLIEYQGEFHDGKSNEFVKSFYNRQHEHDNRKRIYAKEHNIKLLEIWYWDFKNIEEILSRELGLVA